VLDFDHDRVTAWRADFLSNVFPLGGERVEVDGDPESAIAIGAELLRKLPPSDWQNVLGIGLSIPAPVDPETHRTLGHVLRGWEDIDLDGILRGHLRMQIAGRKMAIVADNDANLAALAEYRSLESTHRPGKSLSNLILVKTVPGSIGVGAGAVINGQQLRGRGFAMELGHLSVDTPIPCGANEVECPHCRHTNCLQARISTNALIGGDPAPAWDNVVQWTRETLFSLRGARQSAIEADDLPEVGRIDARLRALAHTDRNTRAIVTAGEEMGRALAKVVTLLDPDVISLEGELARAWLDTGAGSMREIIGNPLGEMFHACAALPNEDPIFPTLASSPSNCAVGAASAVLDQHLIGFILDRVSPGRPGSSSVLPGRSSV
jgi:predicted NBD/HSP70 family sugar kinase